MRRLIVTAGALLMLAACDAPGLGGGRPGNEGEARQEAGPATELVDSMAARNRLPQRDYICTLIGSNRDDDLPYGVMGVTNDRYTLIVRGEGRKEGGLTVTDDRRITVDGDLAVIGGEVRRLTRGRVNTEGVTVELAFDFVPGDSEGRDQVVCSAEA